MRTRNKLGWAGRIAAAVGIVGVEPARRGVGEHRTARSGHGGVAQRRSGLAGPAAPLWLSTAVPLSIARAANAWTTAPAWGLS
jgi:hypothetical protein